MQKYRVSIAKTYSEIREIEAFSPDEAIDVAFEDFDTDTAELSKVWHEVTEIGGKGE